MCCYLGDLAKKIIETVDSKVQRSWIKNLHAFGVLLPFVVRNAKSSNILGQNR